MKTISIINQKGGVSKTTTAENLAAGFRMEGARTLVIDLDQQGNLTSDFEIDVEPEVSSFDILINPEAIGNVIQETKQGDIIPASGELAKIDGELGNEVDQYFRLKEALEYLTDYYDIVIVDCPPSLGKATLNALTASDWAIIPTHAEKYPMAGVGEVIRTIDAVKKYNNPHLRIAGILITAHNARLKIAQEFQERLRALAASNNIKIFETTIRRNTALAEAQSEGMSIFEYAPESNGAKDYQNLLREVKSILEESKNGN